ncbi:MAG: MBOAT family O-acyltransferase, partial [SAR202 cluster bacterium]|nr:MBOAT family O-acyltransferase [SAR202 cluster bacterium]
MLFNSLEYILFLPTVFILYWFVFKKDFKLQNLLILISSYVFYGWWDWRFLSLIFLSTVVDYFVGLNIHNSQDNKVKKTYLWISILFNLGLLGFFKYFNFFIESWIDLLGSFGYEQKSVWTLNVILPVGISFYTFQTMSYSLDIYFKKLKPTRDFISFASFVSFFPQLVAGPIVRASHLLPQLLSKRVFKYDQGVQGLRLILWGMFKKVVIADSLAWRVNYSFENYHTLDGGTLLLGLIYFSIQIYCDFSGYSDIAIGTAKLFGINIRTNFNFPYFSRDIGEFWRRWHISLSSWFRDYLYIPLGGSRGSQWTSIRNIFIIFIVSGFWHGANWNFIVWGLTHALLYIPLFLIGKNRQYTTNVVAENNWFPSIKELFQMGMTFLSTTIAWVFFRSESISDSFNYMILMVSKFSIPNNERSGILFVVILVVFDWTMRKNERNP